MAASADLGLPIVLWVALFSFEVDAKYMVLYYVVV